MAPLKTTPRKSSSLPSSVSAIRGQRIKGDVYESAPDDDDDIDDDRQGERQINYAILRDALSGPIIQRLGPPVSSSSSGSGGGIRTRRRRRDRRRRLTRRGEDDGDGRSESTTTTTTTTHATNTTATSGGDGEMRSRDQENVDDLVDFIDYLTSEVFSHLPKALQHLRYQTFMSLPASEQERYTVPIAASVLMGALEGLPDTINDSLLAYDVLPSQEDCQIFLSAIIETYIRHVTTTLPSDSSKINVHPQACELCARAWIPLTYHHLIPRATHDKVRKRGWHAEWRLDAVAWLCRACHDFVHRVASNEDLARHWFTVERLAAREDVMVWLAWVGKVRWKKR